MLTNVWSGAPARHQVTPKDVVVHLDNSHQACNKWDVIQYNTYKACRQEKTYLCQLFHDNGYAMTMVISKNFPWNSDHFQLPSKTTRPTPRRRPSLPQWLSGGGVAHQRVNGIELRPGINCNHRVSICSRQWPVLLSHEEAFRIRRVIYHPPPFLNDIIYSTPPLLLWKSNKSNYIFPYSTYFESNISNIYYSKQAWHPFQGREYLASHHEERPEWFLVTLHKTTEPEVTCQLILLT